jgi:hypothetical protein
MDTPVVLAARITIAALRSLHQEAGRTGSDRVLLDGKSLTVHEAVKDLAARPKPLDCRASIHGGVLDITTAGPDLRWQAGLEEFARDDQEYIRRVYANGHLARVLIVDDDESFVVDDTIVARWERDYRVPGLAFRISGERPTNRTNDADAAIVFWPTAEDHFQVSIL